MYKKWMGFCLKTTIGFLLLLIIPLAAHSISFGADARTVLNSAPLMPAKTGRIAADELVEQILSQITTPEMDTFSKVKACYDYLIQNTDYDLPRSSCPRSTADAQYVEYGADSAYECLDSHLGVCDDYANAFAALTRAIGLNCYCVIGQTHKASGGMTPHAWNNIRINGVDYVFDPEIEDVISKGGPINYYRFCVTYDEVPGKYAPEAIKNSFVPFDRPDILESILEDERRWQEEFRKIQGW